MTTTTVRPEGEGPPMGACRCLRQPSDRPEYWVVVVREGNYSAFNGYHWTPSAYSLVRCTNCDAHWRTKAAYVRDLRDER